MDILNRDIQDIAVKIGKNMPPVANVFSLFKSTRRWIQLQRSSKQILKTNHGQVPDYRARFFKRFLRYLRSLFLKDFTTTTFLLEPPFISWNSPRTRLSLIDEVPTIHCLWSSRFQRTMHFMHRWRSIVKARVNNAIYPTQFGRFT